MLCQRQYTPLRRGSEEKSLQVLVGLIDRDLAFDVIHTNEVCDDCVGLPFGNDHNQHCFAGRPRTYACSPYNKVVFSVVYHCRYSAVRVVLRMIPGLVLVLCEIQVLRLVL